MFVLLCIVFVWGQMPVFIVSAYYFWLQMKLMPASLHLRDVKLKRAAVGGYITERFLGYQEKMRVKRVCNSNQHFLPCCDSYCTKQCSLCAVRAQVSSSDSSSFLSICTSWTNIEQIFLKYRLWKMANFRLRFLLYTQHAGDVTLIFVLFQSLRLVCGNLTLYAFLFETVLGRWNKWDGREDNAHLH